MALSEQKILLLGCGRMGRSMLEGWLTRGVDSRNVWVVDPGLDPAALPEGVCYATPENALSTGFDVCVIAVKPQLLADVLPTYSALATSGTVFLSVVAGKTLDGVVALLGGSAPIVRVMPNTPAAIGQGISALIGNDEVSDAQRAVCQALMEAVGTALWLETEAQIDAVTALSGSGPAYVFYLTETMAAAGRELGLPADLAAELARHTVSGSGALMAALDDDPAQLRKNVTSPAGTTAAALDVLMDDANGLAPLMLRAMKAAEQRSRELAS